MMSQSKQAAGAKWDARVSLLDSLLNAVPKILESQQPDGRWGSPPWICHDQQNIYPLAAAWAIQDAKNPYYHGEKVLKAIMDGGDVLIQEADSKGMWTFRKKDNSTWGQIYMPWTYSRWIRAFHLIKDAMPPDRRAKWETALTKGYEGIAKTCLGSVHNIPTHHAMGLYCAGLALNREDWKQQVREFMPKVIAAQSADGYWSEHFGPVVAYNFVYSDSLGVYYGMSKDERALDALRRAAIFHANFTYPDGSAVATIDERNGYHSGVNLGNVGFSFTPEGRGYLARQMALYLKNSKSFDADYAATMLLYGGAGEATPTAGEQDRYSFILGKGDAMVVRRKPWFFCVSAFAGVPSKSRWHQDRQNFFSVYHDDLGLVAGGGNTKLQPYLSTFTVGDPSLLFHKPGDENPDFLPAIDLLWYPTAAKLLADPENPGVELSYGEESCTVRLRPVDDKRLTISFKSSCQTGKRVEAHLPFLRRQPSLQTGDGQRVKLGKETVELSGEALRKGIDYGGVHVAPPTSARLVWPVMLHDPYRKDGHSDHNSARFVVCVPLTADKHAADVQLSVEPEPAFPGQVVNTKGLRVLDSSGQNTRYLDDVGTQFFKATASEQSLTFEVKVAKSRQYEFYADFTLSPSYGQARLSVDGQPFDRVFDAYNDELDKSESILFGTRTLAAGLHKFTVEVVGKNEKSTNHYLGIDRVLLKPVK